MKHLYVSEYGNFVGLDGGMCVVKAKDGVVTQQPLSRLKSIHISKSVSLSSDVILACAARGVQIHFTGWDGKSHAAINGLHSHAVVKARKAQLAFVDEPEKCFALSKLMIHGKIANQRAVLLYFSKHHKNTVLSDAANFLQAAARRLEASGGDIMRENWRDFILGAEGAASAAYWSALRDASLLPESFESRDGRGSLEVSNKALNYGYAVLLSRVWGAVTNAGLEPYAGVLHTDRPGKPSLVLDAMEPYRAWVVDRCVVKMRSELTRDDTLNAANKKRLLAEISSAMAARHLYRGKRLMLEAIMQRQAYLLSGHFAGSQKYRSFHFKW